MGDKPERARVREFFDTEEYVTANPTIAVRSLLVRRMLGRVDSCSILDVGCGDGSLSLQFLPTARHITLLDLSPAMLERARRRTPEQYRKRVDYVNADILDFKPTQRYEIVLCVGVLAHVPFTQDVVRKLSDALAHEGRCLLQLSDHSRPLTKALYAYDRARQSLRGSRRYVLTTVTASEVITAASHNRLTLAARENYSFQFPGSRLLSHPWRLRLDKAALSHPRIAAYGMETMILFVKDVVHNVEGFTAHRQGGGESSA